MRSTVALVNAFASLHSKSKSRKAKIRIGAETIDFRDIAQIQALANKAKFIVVSFTNSTKVPDVQTFDNLDDAEKMFGSMGNHPERWDYVALFDKKDTREKGVFPLPAQEFGNAIFTIPVVQTPPQVIEREVIKEKGAGAGLAIAALGTLTLIGVAGSKKKKG